MDEVKTHDLDAHASVRIVLVLLANLQPSMSFDFVHDELMMLLVIDEGMPVL